VKPTGKLLRSELVSSIPYTQLGEYGPVCVNAEEGCSQKFTDSKSGLRYTDTEMNLTVKHFGHKITIAHLKLLLWHLHNWTTNMFFFNCENNQPDAPYRLIYYFKSALHISGENIVETCTADLE
jgi:hypothetical protein